MPFQYKHGFWVVSALLVIVIASVLFMFVQGSTKPLKDGRVAVVLNEDERSFALMTMRNFLEAVSYADRGIEENNLELLNKAALIAGFKAEINEPKSIKLKLPLGFKKMAHEIHVGFDELPKMQQAGAERSQLRKQLNNTMNLCISCHASYAITTK